jgi:hypothetical protein
MCWNAIANNAKAVTQQLNNPPYKLTTSSLWQKAAPTTSATCKRFANAVTAVKVIGLILGLTDGFARQLFELRSDQRPPDALDRTGCYSS